MLGSAFLRLESRRCTCARTFASDQAWEQVVIAFSGYGFNQGHATAYADVSYRLAYLKAQARAGCTSNG